MVIKIVGFALFPFAGMILGGIIASFYPPNSKLRSIILHFAAGVVFSVVSVEILPSILKSHTILINSLGFGTGVILMLIIRHFTRKAEKTDKINLTGPIAAILPMGLLVGIGVDIFIDGILLGIGFATGEKAGLLLTAALTLEIMALGLAVAAKFGKEGFIKSKTIMTISLLAVSIIFGALIGVAILQMLSGLAFDFVLSFGLAALLYLITEELLVEAHEEPDTPLNTATFFIGFLLFMILGMLE
jgi:zinc transporter, ZIP family